MKGSDVAKWRLDLPIDNRVDSVSVDNEVHEEVRRHLFRCQSSKSDITANARAQQLDGCCFCFGRHLFNGTYD
jgi:hypothetical protein